MCVLFCKILPSQQNSIKMELRCITDYNRIILISERRYLTILFIISGELGKAPAAVQDSLPVAEPEGATAASDDEGEVEEMQARLEALRS